MAEARESSTTPDKDRALRNGGSHDGESQAQHAEEHAEEHAAQGNAQATEGVPRGPNTPENLEQILDVSDVPTRPGIQMHPSSIIVPSEELDIAEGDDEETLP